jgi:hypothetical protein
MRLINVQTREMVDFSTGDIPPYAILSHTWGTAADEVSYQDFSNPTISTKKLGFRKIQYICIEAQAARIDYAWVDTCCIDKTSSIELSEAINSMFAWYSKAEICYVYLSDVDLTIGSDLDSNNHDLLRNSRWFTRGWTLQELLAPKSVVFYDANWRPIGNKISCSATICSITGINTSFLSNTSEIFKSLWATRMCWSAKRDTSRPEDAAYCLLGLVGIHLPLLYGEGKKAAFRRLQHELIQKTSSHSLLAWDLDSSPPIELTLDSHRKFPNKIIPIPILADYPDQFVHTPRDLTPPDINYYGRTKSDQTSWIVGNCGFEVELLLITNKAWFVENLIEHTGIQKTYDLAIALLPLRPSKTVIEYLGLLLSGDSRAHIYNRISSTSGASTVRIHGRFAARAHYQKICLTNQQAAREYTASSARNKIVYFECAGFEVEVTLLRHCEWNKNDRSLMLQSDVPDAIQEALLRIVVGDKTCKAVFSLLLSNSVIKQPDTLSPQPSSDYWHFRKLGIAVLNHGAEQIFNNPTEHPRNTLGLNTHNIVVKTNIGLVSVTLKETSVDMDILYFVKIRLENGNDQTSEEEFC